MSFESALQKLEKTADQLEALNHRTTQNWIWFLRKHQKVVAFFCSTPFYLWFPPRFFLLVTFPNVAFFIT